MDKLVIFLFTLTTQVLAAAPPKAYSKSSYAKSPTSSIKSNSEATPVNTVVLTPELVTSQASLEEKLQRQFASFNQAKDSFTQQSSNWYILSPEVKSAFEEYLESVERLIQQAASFTKGAQRLSSALQAAGPSIQSEWVDRLRKLQGLANLALDRSAVGITSITRTASEVTADQQVYVEAKNQQLADTKTQMDATLQQLLEQTLQIGRQASAVLSQAIKEWTTLLRSHLGTTAAEPAVIRLRELAEPTLLDLARLRPEDIETTMSDAHRTLEDIKGLFLTSNISSSVVRQTINPVQLAVFATLTRARNVHPH